MSGSHSMEMAPPHDESDDQDRDRDERGVYVETYPLEDFIDCLTDDDLATTNDVADCVGASYQTAYRKLRILEDRGEVESKKLGSTRVWSLTDDQEGGA